MFLILRSEWVPKERLDLLSNLGQSSFLDLNWAP